MRKYFLILIFSGLCISAQAQYTFYCVGKYVTGAECDICTGTTQARLFNGIIVKQGATVRYWLDCPILVKQQGGNLVFQELIYPNPETVTINLLSTGYADINEFRDSVACPCAMQDTSAGGGGGGDPSITNEGILGVDAGGGNDALLTSNTTGANGVTVSGSNTILVTESTSSNGGTITVQGDTSLLATVNDINAIDCRWCSVKKAMPFYSNNPQTAFEALRTYWASRMGEIVVDTTVLLTANTTVAASVRFVGGGNINVDAGHTLTFQSTVSAEPKHHVFTGAGTYAFDPKSTRELYVYWFGALGNGSADDYDEIQKCVDAAIASEISSVRFLSGEHRISKGVLIRNGSSFVNLIMEGRANNDSDPGTMIACTDSTNFAIGIQGARVVIIRNMYIAGYNRSYNPTISQIISNTVSTWATQYGRNNRYSPFSGIVIDPFKNGAPTGGGYPGFSAQYSNTQALSSNVLIENVVIRYFVVAAMISPSGLNGNGSEITFRNCGFYRSQYGLALGNNQSRSVDVFSSYFIDNAACMDGVTFGGQVGVMPNMVGGQVGRCKDIFRFNTGIGDFKVSDIYGESIYRIGKFNGNNGAVVNFANCEFKFATSTETSLPDAASVLDAANLKVVFAGGSAHYSTSRPLEMNVAYLIMQGVYLTRPVINNPSGNSRESRVIYENCHIQGYSSQYSSATVTPIVDALDYQRIAGLFPVYQVPGQRIAFYELSTTFRNTATFTNTNDAEDHTVLLTSSASVTVDTTARTATFTVAIPERYRIGDILFSYNNFSSATPNATQKTCTFGIVTNISGTTITCGHIPSGIVSGTYVIYLWAERIFTGTFLANITSGSNKCVIVSKNNSGPTVAQVWPVGTRVYSKSNQSPTTGLYTGLYVSSVTADTLFLSGNVGSTVSNLEIFNADYRGEYWSEDNTYQTASSTFRTVGYQTGDRIIFASHAYRASAIVTAGGFTPTVKFIFKPLSGLAASKPSPTADDAGLTYYSTDTDDFEIWDGSAWNILSVGAGAYYQTFLDDGTPLAQQPNANFESTSDIAFTLVNDGANTETEINADIPANAVDYAEIQQVAANRLLGNPTGSTADVSEIPLAAGLSFSGGALTPADASATNEVWTIDADDADTELITTQTVKFQGGGIVVTDYVPGTDILTITGTEIDGSTTNEVWTIDADDADTEAISTQTVKFQGGGINVTDYIPGTDILTITGTEVDGSTTNELQTITNSSDATSHTVTLSNSGGSVQLIEGSNITLTTGGTASAGTVTIAATGGGTNYQTVRDDGVDETQRAALNFVSTSTVNAIGTDDAGNNETEIALNVPTDGITATEIAAGAVGTSEIATNAVANVDFRQGIARSVVGVTGNATADVADIQGTADQVLRVNSAGTALAFGAVNLASTNAVTGTLPVGNGGTGAATFVNNRVLTGNGTSAIVDEPNLTFDGTTLSVTSKYAQPIGGSYSTSQNFNNISGTVTSTANSLTHHALLVNPTFANDGTTTGQTYYGGNFTVTTSGSTAANNIFGLFGSASNSSVNTATLYGTYGRITESENTTTLANRAAGRYEAIFAGSGDFHTGFGFRADVSNSSTGRWLTGYGSYIQNTNSKTAYGHKVILSNTRSTANTQFGIDIESNVSGSGVVVDNSYGVFLRSAASSSGVITNYYGVYQNSVPAGATNTYFLFGNQSTAHSYLSGTLSVGVNSATVAKALIRGTGATSATMTATFENSGGSDILNIRDDQRVGIITATPNRTLEVSGETRITDLVTDTPTKIVGADADGDLDTVGIGAEAELHLTNGTLGTNFHTTISPAQLTAGTTNNWNPTGLSTAWIIELSGDNKFEVITGIVAPTFNKTLTLYNTGTNSVLFPEEFTTSTAANRFNFELVLFPGKNAVIRYSVTLARWTLISTGDNYRDVEHLYFNEVFNAPVSIDPDDYDFWNVISETAASLTAPGSGRMKGLSVNTGSSAGGKGSVSSKEVFFENNGTAGTATWAYCKAVIQTPSVLSDGTDDYTIRVGFNVAVGGGGTTDGFYFQYNHSLVSGNWGTATTNSGSTELNNSGVAVTTSTVYVLEVIFRPNTLVEYFINGTRVATNSTFIPTGDDMLVMSEIEKSLGTAQRDLITYTLQTQTALVD